MPQPTPTLVHPGSGDPPELMAGLIHTIDRTDVAVPVRELAARDRVSITPGTPLVEVVTVKRHHWIPSLASVHVRVSVDGHWRPVWLALPADTPCTLIEAFRETRPTCTGCGRACIYICDTATTQPPEKALCVECDRGLPPEALEQVLRELADHTDCADDAHPVSSTTGGPA